MKPHFQLLAATLALATPATAQEDAISRFLCSGIGEEAAEEETAFPHTLKVVYAQDDGKYLGDIAIVLTQGGKTLLETRCPGPWLLANLPDGVYDLRSTYEGRTQSGQIRVGGSDKQVTIRF